MLNVMTAIFEDEGTSKAVVNCESTEAFASMVMNATYQWLSDNGDNEAMTKAIKARAAIIETLN